jgi:hypothetical protein
METQFIMSSFCYARTAEGQSAAYDATSAMPRKLRSLLKVIDGKTSNEVFANSLRAFGDVQGLLSSLQKAGLIELRAVATDAGKAASVESADASVRRSAKATQVDATGFAPTQAVHTHSIGSADSRMGQPNAQQEQERQQDLQLLVQDMSSFVLAYVPAQAFSVLSELEQINSMEQMAVLLGGYELMVRDVGEPARIHLMHVRQMLGKWL